MDAKEYKIKIETSKIENDFERYTMNRLNPVRIINFTVFAYDYENARDTAMSMCSDISGHEYDEEMDIMEVEEIKLSNGTEHSFDSDYSQLL